MIFKYKVEFQWPIKISIPWKYEVVRSIKNRNLLKAIKIIRDNNNCGLREAKEIFETKFYNKYKES